MDKCVQFIASIWIKILWICGHRYGHPSHLLCHQTLGLCIPHHVTRLCYKKSSIQLHVAASARYIETTIKWVYFHLLLSSINSFAYYTYNCNFIPSFQKHRLVERLETQWRKSFCFGYTCSTMPPCHGSITTTGSTLLLVPVTGWNVVVPMFIVFTNLTITENMFEASSNFHTARHLSKFKQGLNSS